MAQKRSLSGIRSSGTVHIGNFLGMIQPALARQKDYHCMYFIADMHSLTTNKDPKRVREETLNIVAVWLALGLDVTKHILWAQSDLPMVAEFAWYLSCTTGLGLLEKGHAYKDSLAQGGEVNHGVFAYPTLMAADILMYDADVVPVGKDQKQHVEMARDMAGSFNAVYGDVIKLPQPMIDEKVMVIPGLDGKKMSKSYDNVIPLFCDESTLRKKVMSLKTDSTPLEAPKSLKGSVLGQLYELFASSKQFEDLEQRMQKGGMGWGHAKEELAQVINTVVCDARGRYNEFVRDVAYLDSILDQGAQHAYAIAEPVLNRVRKAVGVKSFPWGGFTR